METDGAGTLKLELIPLLQKISDSLWVLGGSSNIIDIYANVLIDIVIGLHPDVRFCHTGLKPHISEAISETFMPTKS